ncbi:MAG: glutamyl-tRNA reductase [Thermodesulfovibrionales bacterium]|nr:glutamyl-tRNA reductase [Thermodesulfovibrionales bacterium]
MDISVIGLNHKTASVDLREKLAFSGQKFQEALMGLKNLPMIDEVALLSTCNRVEIYVYGRNSEKTYETIKNFLSIFHQIDKTEFEPALYFYTNRDAVKHVFRVASSLDSMIIGEPQILGQLKEAFDFALNKKTTGSILNRLMKKAISTAKRVRTETRIAENAVSISFAAVELAKKIFKELPGKSFMLLGAGEMAELAARHLISNGVKDVKVANRTYERGCELAKEFNGKAVRFEDFLKELLYTDIVICSTGATEYILKKEQMQKIMKDRKNKPVFIIDISVPRNIDPDINQIDNVYLYNIDDLQQVVDNNLLERRKEAEKAEAIVEEEVEKFLKWLESLDSIPLIISIRQKAEAIKKEELEKFRHRFQNLDKEHLEAIEHLASSITNKLIHPPTIALKESSEDKELLAMAIKKLYGLNEDEEEE